MFIIKVLSLACTYLNKLESQLIHSNGIPYKGHFVYLLNSDGIEHDQLWRDSIGEYCGMVDLFLSCIIFC